MTEAPAPSLARAKEVAMKFSVMIWPFSGTEKELIELCHENLASYKKPKSVEFVTSLPRTRAERF